MDVIRTNRENLIVWYRGQAREATFKIIALLAKTREPEEAEQLEREIRTWQERLFDSLDEISRLNYGAAESLHWDKGCSSTDFTG